MGLIQKICAAIKKEDGRAFLVGGLIRDQIMADLGLIPKEELPPARDFDIEAYQITAEKLRSVLSTFGRVDAVGEAFTVYKLAFGKANERIELDISLPRRESKTGHGHKGFTVTGDPFMTTQEAARRRDFTINAIMCNPLTGEVLDHYKGVEDLKTRTLRVVDPSTFIEDSLRVLRAMQFAARFDFSLAEETKTLCKTIDLTDLPCERIWGEIEKLLLRAKKPSKGWQIGLEIGVVDQLFPELKTLVGCPQEKEWHPEGDVWIHTLQSIDEASKLINDLPKAQKITVMLAVLFHDTGKPSTTKEIDGRIRSLAHEEAGVKPTEKLLDRLNIHTLDGYNVREQVIALVANHLKPGQFYKQKETVTDGAFRRLARKCEMDLLYLVAKADSLGRHATDAPEPNSDAQEWFIKRVSSLGIEKSAPEAILMGRHLLELGIKPGKQMGEIIRTVYELQLDGKVTNLEEATIAAQKLLNPA
jgi:tRNA nucleotidyltransferase (CCA-adding enzyme)